VVTPPPVQNGTLAPAKPNAAGNRQTQQRPASPVDPDATSLRGQASRLRAGGLQPVPPPVAEDVPVTPRPPPVPAAVAPRTPAAAPRTPAAAPKTPEAAMKRDTTGAVRVELPSVDIDPGPTPPPVAVPASTPAHAEAAIPQPASPEVAIPEPVEEPRLEAPPVEEPSIEEAAHEEASHLAAHEAPSVEDASREVEHEAPAALEAPSTAEESPVLDLGSIVEPAFHEELAVEGESAVHEEPPIVRPAMLEELAIIEPAMLEEPVVQEQAAADQGAIPSRAMHEGDSERNLSPLAHTLAHIAEEAQRRSEAGLGSGELAEDELELVDAPLDAPPAAPAARPVAPPIPMLPAAAYATPPPLPAILAKSSAPPLPAAEAPAADTSGVVAPPLPEALAERPRRPKRSKPWFEEIFDEDYLRTLPFMTPEQTMREVAFIEASLEATPGAEILDVGCGYGRHAIELVQKGLIVTGLDLSLPLLIKAADDAQRRSVSVNFVHADMRELPFDRKFDGAYCMLTSFGYFDEDANLKVAEGVARALKPGGRFLLDIVNRDYVVSDLPTRIWWEGVGCVVLEEVDFNFHTSRIVTRRSVVFEDGRQLEQEISVRAYSLHELGRLLRQAGFRVLDISGSMATRGRFLGGNSRNLLVLAEKRSD
jgi:SAM-dependent methyltransferase